MLATYQQDELSWERLKTMPMDGESLVPAIIQDERTGTVLMLGFMNRAAFEQTRSTGRVTFYSRSRKRLWTKGETSGNHLTLVSMHFDCDRDTLLVRALPSGPVCHTGDATCFGAAKDFSLSPRGRGEGEGRLDVIQELCSTIRARKSAMPAGSYTTHLFTSGIAHIGAKVMEEAEEVARAARQEGKRRTIEEAADVLYHLLVLLAASDVLWEDVLAELQQRSGKKPTTGTV